MQNPTAAELAAIVENATVGVATFSLDGQFLTINQTFCQILDCKAKAVIGKNYRDFLFEPQHQESEVPFSRMFDLDQPRLTVKNQLMTVSGQTKWLTLSCNLVLDEKGGADHIVTIAQDISEQKRLREENRLAAVAFKHSGDGILITDSDHTIVQVNPAFSRISGFKDNEIIGRKPFLLRSGEHDDIFYNHIWKTLELEGFWQGEICYRHKNNSLFYVWETISTVTDSSGEIINYVSILSDMTEIKLREQMLDDRANYDELTDLPNRYYLKANLNQALEMSKRRGHKAALLFIDLNKFKPINDQYGHSAGDALLVEVASRISKAIRLEDTAARIGGDEFLILMPKVIARDDIQLIAERIHQSLIKPIKLLENTEVSISASIGISIFPDDLAGPSRNVKHQTSNDDQALIDLADMAMYKAKQDARAICFFDQLEQENHDRSAADKKNIRSVH